MHFTSSLTKSRQPWLSIPACLLGWKYISYIFEFLGQRASGFHASRDGMLGEAEQIRLLPCWQTG